MVGGQVDLMIFKQVVRCLIHIKDTSYFKKYLDLGEISISLPVKIPCSENKKVFERIQYFDILKLFCKGILSCGHYRICLLI